MQAELEKLSKEDLIVKLINVSEELAQIKKLIFGGKSERFLPTDTNQLSLGIAAEEKLPEVKTEEVSYTRAKTNKPTSHKGRMPLPAHLPRVEHIIEPEENTEGMKTIGVEVTETLEYVPGKLLVNKYVRTKYAKADGEGVVIGKLPSRLIEKGIAEASVIAYLLTSKYVDHLPLYRQIEMFKRLGITLPSSTVSDWASDGLMALKPLYDALVKKIKGARYLQVDETPLQVQDKDKKGSTHRGYYWVYHSVEDNLVIFDYRKGRSREGPEEILENYNGYLQCDGYGVYDAFVQKKSIALIYCMAHARRYFTNALENHKEHAEHALAEIQLLYDVERECRLAGLNYSDRLELRKEKSVSVLNRLGEWMKEVYPKVTPQSSIGKAIHYSLSRWEKLSLYAENGMLEIDNNWIENSIRPVALGRKNYLFAGSHEAAQRAAMIYSLFACCKKNDVNPVEWLTDILNRISDHPINKIEELLPNKWKELRKA